VNNKRYLILALLGALIIGISCYLFLNSFMERVEILVFSRDIQQGEPIGLEDLKLRQFYRQGLPDNYLTDKSEVIGKKINMDRKKDDFISAEMLLKSDESQLSYELGRDEVLIAINILNIEPLLPHLKPGQYISLVSTIKDSSIQAAGGYKYTEEDHIGNILIPGQYIESNTFNLSKNILYIDGYIIIRDLEIFIVEKVDSSTDSILTGIEGRESIYIYLKCSIEEAPYISALASNDNFKIILEGAD